MFDTTLIQNFDMAPSDPGSDLVGSLVWDGDNDILGLRYHDDGVTEDLTTNLECWGHLQEPGCVFIKNDPPYTGLVERLEGLGLVRVTKVVTYGPFAVTAHQVRPIVSLEAPAAGAA